jgi:hypothetical protein
MTIPSRYDGRRTGRSLQPREATMADPLLRTVTRTSGANAALKDGTVVPHGFRFDFAEIPVLVQGFRRMVRGLEFDSARWH